MSRNNLIKLICVMLIILTVSLTALTLVSSLNYKKNSVVDLKIPCEINEDVCSSSTSCNITVRYPNGTYMTRVFSATYNHSTGDANYTLPNANTVGEYTSRMTCKDGVYNGTTNFVFLVTTSGEESTIADSLLYGFALLILLLFLGFFIYGFYKNQNPTHKVIFGWASYIILILVSYLMWITTENILFTSSFLPKIFSWTFTILLWGFLPVFFGSCIWLIWLLITIAPIKRMLDRGVPEDRAIQGKFKMGGNPKEW